MKDPGKDRGPCFWRSRALRPALVAAAAIVILAACTRVRAGSQDAETEPQFTYVGGTENIVAGCRGSLQLTDDSLLFTCERSSLTIPYASIELMQYRPDVTRKIRRMKVNWKVQPPGRRAKENRYFTIVFSEGEATHVTVLRVRPLPMRPYLAEIDLKSRRQIEVYGYEDFR